jgi:hypothetical protein
MEATINVTTVQLTIFHQLSSKLTEILLILQLVDRFIH